MKEAIPHRPDGSIDLTTYRARRAMRKTCDEYEVDTPLAFAFLLLRILAYVVGVFAAVTYVAYVAMVSS